jgi:hypothetical protein
MESAMEVYMRIGMLLILVVVVSGMCVGCGKAKGDDRPLEEYLIGKWSISGMHTYVFSDDGTVSIDGQTNKWGVDSDDPELLRMQFSVDQDQIKVRKIDEKNMEWDVAGDKYRLKRE